MTRIGYDARGHGQTPGVTVVGNEGVIDLATGLNAVVQAGSTLTFEGTDLVEFVAIANEVSRLDADTGTVLSGDRFSLMHHIEAMPTPTTETRIAQIKDSGDVNTVGYLCIDTSRRFLVRNGGGGGGALILGPMTAVAENAEVRINVAGDLTALDGRLDIYTTNPRTSTTPDESDIKSGTVNWNGYTSVATARWGVPHTAPALTYRSRYGVAEDGTAAPLAPLTDPITGGDTITAPVAAFTITNDFAGGDGGPYAITAVVQQTGASVGTMGWDGFHVYGTLANVDECTFDVTVKDGNGTGPTSIVKTYTLPAPSSGGSGLYLHDPTLNAGAGGFLPL